MLTHRINFKNFQVKKNSKVIKKDINYLLNLNNELINSLKKNYKFSYKKKLIHKYKKFSNVRIFGMGGSILGTQAIYDFLKHKIKKKFYFVNNLKSFTKKQNTHNFLNLIVSKSGNTTEKIVNTNIFIKKKQENIFITENKKSYLHILAQKLKSEIVHHNNYIGGRYSVLSEVGMLPAELMGLSSNKFKQFNNLIKNKGFLNHLINNVQAILFFQKKKKFNSVIINYDKKSEDLFSWYQQLIAESLGKNNTGLLPIISNMPKDNHSVMQLYLDGFKNNFFTFFYVHENKSTRILSNEILNSHNFIKKKNIENITYAQKKATEKVFDMKNIPYRSFDIKKRDEKTLGELFCFFILETILIGRALKVNPYDQPSVEIIKKETKKILI